MPVPPITTICRPYTGSKISGVSPFEKDGSEQNNVYADFCSDAGRAMNSGMMQLAVKSVIFFASTKKPEHGLISHKG